MSRPTQMNEIGIDYKSLMNQIKADMSNCFHIVKMRGQFLKSVGLLFLFDYFIYY